MKRVAFKMQLLPGYEEEYQKRHDAIWPELVELLHQNGISDYYIFLDPETHILFATYMLSEDHQKDRLPQEAVMKKWWAYMKDIMETHEDNSPVSKALTDVFYMK
uniref:L-rhamnose mutarotase n=1 Tax=Roseihalotalea indica TaxID=2867963 RepID=A0AA49PZZ5_9BACT|nr:L-rhamnose mutarotase [Tunicatimonas sp. TK19036]